MVLPPGSSAIRWEQCPLSTPAPQCVPGAGLVLRQASPRLQGWELLSCVRNPRSEPRPSATLRPVEPTLGKLRGGVCGSGPPTPAPASIKSEQAAGAWLLREAMRRGWGWTQDCGEPPSLGQRAPAGPHLGPQGSHPSSSALGSASRPVQDGRLGGPAAPSSPCFLSGGRREEVFPVAPHPTWEWGCCCPGPLLGAGEEGRKAWGPRGGREHSWGSPSPGFRPQLIHHLTPHLSSLISLCLSCTYLSVISINLFFIYQSSIYLPLYHLSTHQDRSSIIYQSIMYQCIICLSSIYPSTCLN